ncbi:M81 family metallopeptidase [Bradyrhizobium sp. LHD-71]|uniref:M81 family metallopeptidase n=1 Tax=Bradyrhizobium sp. LHD-71 TaxID=3072141 RepID=UPI00280CB790|nr:M81 family metallopeptidase [Bradyrhizobium sp. LHD-71]MDQ8727677.1 M81 family metallopeptidase [Bradyrhizobium sp. LHD-71]
MNSSGSKPRFRIAIAGFLQESVTFIGEMTTLEQFQLVEAAGPALIDGYRGTNTGIGGMIDACERENADIIPLFYTFGGAAGPTSDEAYDHYIARLLEGLKAAGRLDGVLLDLHGAMATPKRLDADRETLERVRALVGPDVPVMVALDYHANLDQDSIAAADAVFGYHFSPHTDMGPTGERAAGCLFRKLRGEITPVCVLVKPGVMVPSIFSATGMEPLKSVVARSIEESKQATDYLDISVFAGFSYADVPNCGFSVVVVADGKRSLAREIAERFSDEIFAMREALNHKELVTSVDEGIDRAKHLVAAGQRPVVLLEHADRMHDSTYVLREVLRQQLPRTVVPYVWDAQAAAAAVAAGRGATVKLSVGGHSSDRAGGPVQLEGRVIHAGRVTYRATGPYFTGRTVELGETAVIDTGSVVVSLTSVPSTAVDDDCLTQFGQTLDEYDYVVLRSKTHFRAFFEQVAAAILIIDTPDWGPADLTSLPYRHVPVDRVYPFARL